MYMQIWLDVRNVSQLWQTLHVSCWNVRYYLLTSQEHRAEIDARDSTFQAFEDFGKELLDKEHYASPDIREKLDTMAQEREELEKWDFCSNFCFVCFIL